MKGHLHHCAWHRVSPQDMIPIVAVIHPSLVLLTFLSFPFWKSQVGSLCEEVVVVSV